jgi:hypothetical protein
MANPRKQLLAAYRRLAGRRDMNRRSADVLQRSGMQAELQARMESYQNAINDLCDAFQVTEDELRRELEAHHEA